MEKTTFSKKIDSVGRIIIPAKLRTQLELNIGDIVEFYIHKQDNKTYLCFECPNAEKQKDAAITMLKNLGYEITFKNEN